MRKRHHRYYSIALKIITLIMDSNIDDTGQLLELAIYPDPGST